MRSLLLNRLSRQGLRKPHPLVVGHLRGGARFMSEIPLCHIVGAEHCGSTSRDGDIGKLVIRNVIAPAGSGTMVLDKTVPMELMTETGTIGASQGWVATLKDGVVCLQDDLNPNTSSESEPKRISLPRLETLPQCQTQFVTNVAMSSSSPEDDENCVVAVKFVDPQLSLCRRPGQKDAEWVNIRITDPGFFESQIMYSKRDKMFSMAGSGGTHTGSWDLEKHKARDLFFPFYQEFVQSKWEELTMQCRSEHLLESPTGQTYLVKWYKRCNDFTLKDSLEQFLVFEVLDKGINLWTKDIGDVCFFLSSKGESFCLQASLYGLSPNCIYYVDGNEFGKVNVGDSVKSDGGTLSSPAPYFIPPPPQA